MSQILQSVTNEPPTKITRPQPTWCRHLLGQLLQKDPNLRPTEAILALDHLDQQKPFSH